MNQTLQGIRNYNLRKNNFGQELIIQKKKDLWKEYYVYNANFLPLASGTGVTFSDFEIRIDTDAPFEFIKTIHVATSNDFRLKYRDDTNGRFLMKASQNARTISGTALSGITTNGFLPFIWPRPYNISGGTTFNVQAADDSGANNTIRIAFHGSKIRQGKAPWDKKYRARVPYIYPLPTHTSSVVSGQVLLGALGTLSLAIATDSDAPFLCEKIVGTSTGALLLTIKDGARDRQWMDSPTHFDNLVGNSQYPNNMPSPRFIERQAVISITMTDLSNASNTVELNFIGEKLYE